MLRILSDGQAPETDSGRSNLDINGLSTFQTTGRALRLDGLFADQFDPGKRAERIPLDAEARYRLGNMTRIDAKTDGIFDHEGSIGAHVRVTSRDDGYACCNSMDKFLVGSISGTKLHSPLSGEGWIPVILPPPVTSRGQSAPVRLIEICHYAIEKTVLYQNSIAGRRAFIIKSNRIWFIDNGYEIGRDPLPHPLGKRPFIKRVRFQHVTHGFVQPHPTPSTQKNDWQVAFGRGCRLRPVGGGDLRAARNECCGLHVQVVFRIKHVAHGSPC